jgi:hypothetical protein
MSRLVSEAPALRSESEHDVNEQDQVVSLRTLNANNGSRLGIAPGPSGALPEASEMTSVHGDIVAPVAKDASLDAAERRRVITGAINNLRQHYFDREVAQETAGALLAHEKNGDDDAAKDGVRDFVSQHRLSQS